VNAVVAQETKSKLELSSPQDVAFATPKHLCQQPRKPPKGWLRRLLFHVLLALASSLALFTLFCAIYLLGHHWPLLSDALPLLSAGVGGYLANAVTCWTSQCMLQTWTPLIIL